MGAEALGGRGRAVAGAARPLPLQPRAAAQRQVGRRHHHLGRRARSSSSPSAAPSEILRDWAGARAGAHQHTKVVSVKRSISSRMALWAVAAAVALTALPAWAEPKIGVVDPQKLLLESPQGKAMAEAMRTEFAPRQRTLQAQGQALKAKEEKLQKDGATMTRGPAAARGEGAARRRARLRAYARASSRTTSPRAATRSCRACSARWSRRCAPTPRRRTTTGAERRGGAVLHPIRSTSRRRFSPRCRRAAAPRRRPAPAAPTPAGHEAADALSAALCRRECACRSRSGSLRSASAASCAAIRTRASSAWRRSPAPTSGRSRSSPTRAIGAQLPPTRAAAVVLEPRRRGRRCVPRGAAGLREPVRHLRAHRRACCTRPAARARCAPERGGGCRAPASIRAPGSCALRERGRGRAHRAARVGRAALRPGGGRHARRRRAPRGARHARARGEHRRAHRAAAGGGDRRRRLRFRGRRRRAG